MASKKTAVIEFIFDQRYDPAKGTVDPIEVSFNDLTAAISATGADLATGNLANFFKDIVRLRTRNQIFPASVVAKGFTAEQHVGTAMSFRFIPLPQGQTTAFADLMPDPAALADPQVLQSVSLSVPSRRLGRQDESWLTQVAARLHLIDTHLALVSTLPVLGVDLLQTNVSLRSGEVDAVFLAAVSKPGGGVDDLLISCEMKSRTEMLEPEQVLRGAQALAESRAVLEMGTDIKVVPMAVKALGDGLLWVLEYESDFPPLKQTSQRVYRFEPSVKGIS